jgi:hypothetical protein
MIIRNCEIYNFIMVSNSVDILLFLKGKFPNYLRKDLKSVKISLIKEDSSTFYITTNDSEKTDIPLGALVNLSLEEGIKRLKTLDAYDWINVAGFNQLFSNTQAILDEYFETQ